MLRMFVLLFWLGTSFSAAASTEEKESSPLLGASAPSRSNCPFSCRDITYGLSGICCSCTMGTSMQILQWVVNCLSCNDRCAERTCYCCPVEASQCWCYWYDFPKNAWEHACPHCCRTVLDDRPAPKE